MNIHPNLVQEYARLNGLVAEKAVLELNEILAGKREIPSWVKNFSPDFWNAVNAKPVTKEEPAETLEVAEEPKKRKRRTKAEIEADKAKEETETAE